MTAQHVLAAVSIVSLAACSPAPRSQAELIGATDARRLYTPVPVASLSDAERAALVSGSTTRDVVAFVRDSPAGHMMKAATCLYGTKVPGDVTYNSQLGEAFRVPAHVHVFVVGPIGGESESYKIAMDNGVVGLVCPNSMAAG